MVPVQRHKIGQQRHLAGIKEKNVRMNENKNGNSSGSKQCVTPAVKRRGDRETEKGRERKTWSCNETEKKRN